MDYVESIRKMDLDVLDSLWRGVKEMPEDKLNWKVTPDVRSALELLQELVSSTRYVVDLARTQDPENTPFNGCEETDLAKLEEAQRKVFSEFHGALAAFPEDRLGVMIDLPWGHMSYFQALTYAHWNLVYHWGQVNYVQTAYGDKESR